MKHHRIFKTGLAMILASIGCATARAQESVESLVEPPPGSIAPTPPGAVVPPGIQQKIEESLFKSEQEERRIAEESGDAMRRRRAEETADYEHRGAEFQGRREQSQARDWHRGITAQATLTGMSRRVSNRLSAVKAEHIATNARWDAEAANDMREFRAHQKEEMARRVAEGRKLGNQLSLCLGGPGAEGGLTSIIGGLGGAKTAEVVTEATGDAEAIEVNASPAGTQPAAALASVGVEGLRRIANRVGDREILRDLSPQSLQTCQPVLGEPPSPDVRALRLLGYGDRSPCGASRDASALPRSCFAPGTQDDACAVHDKALKTCGAPWSALGNECVYRAHRDLARQSPDPVLKGTFLFLRWLSPHNTLPAELNDWVRTGIPMYPPSPRL